MTRIKSIIGALVLCALAISAFGAASASATGLTAVECKNVGVGQYNNNHCTTPKAPGEYETVVIEGKQEVEGTDTRNLPEGGHGPGDTNNPVAVFHGTVGGSKITVTCGHGLTTGGSIENKTVGEEMRIHTTKAVVHWTECHASPETKPEKACKVKGTSPETPEGEITTNPLTATTEANHKVVIKSEKEEEGVPVFTRFTILKSSTPNCFTGSDLPVKVTGEAWGRADTTTHSHLTLDAVSNEGSPLRANNVSASQTETVTGFTKGNKDLTVGTETF